MKHRFPRIAFALLLSCFAASAADGKTPDHTAIVMVSGELPALKEDVYMFNSRSGYSASAVFSVGVKKRPDPHKEYILCHSSVAWSGGGLGLEEIYDENGEVNEWSIRVTADRAAQWGAEHAVEAKVSFYETLENPPPGEAHSHSLLAEASDSVTVVAPEVKIKSISFNHTPGDSAGDGIDLRESYAGPDIVAPEWTSGGNAKPVAYRAGVSPVFIVDFELLPKCLKNLKVRARESTNGVSLVGGTKTITTSPENVRFNGLKEISYRVDKGDLIWRWSALAFNGISVNGWTNFKETKVPCFVLCGEPLSPWKEAGGTQTPWVSALNFIMDTCKVKGYNTKTDVLSALTRGLYAHKSSYSEAPVCPEHDGKNPTGQFYYTKFITTTSANCEDAASGLRLSANMLGVDLESAYEYNAADMSQRAWDFHCYAVSGYAYVYDTCRWEKNKTPIVRMNLKNYRKWLNPLAEEKNIKPVYYCILGVK